jgi:hypothetical protein
VVEHIRAVPKGFAASKLGKGLMDAIAAGRTAQAPEGIQQERPRSPRQDVLNRAAEDHRDIERG